MNEQTQQDKMQAVVAELTNGIGFKAYYEYPGYVSVEKLAFGIDADSSHLHGGIWTGNTEDGEELGFALDCNADADTQEVANAITAIIGKRATVAAFIDYIKACERDDSPATDAAIEQAQTDAFNAAERNGWDWSNDEEWNAFSLHATALEIAHEGLKRYRIKAN